MNPEQTLWRAVLDRAYLDARLEGRERIPARKWLMGESNLEDLRLVCEFADILVDRVVGWARKEWS